MSDPFLAYLDDERAKIRKHMQRLDDKMAELDKSEKLYRASGAAPVNKESSPNKTPPHKASNTSKPPKPPEIIEYGIKPNDTIKERVVAILEKHKEGLASGQILRILQATGRPDMERVSLSPQLSRLRKKDRALEANAGIYRLRKKNEESDDIESLV